MKVNSDMKTFSDDDITFIMKKHGRGMQTSDIVLFTDNRWTAEEIEAKIEEEYEKLNARVPFDGKLPHVARE